MHDRLLAGDDNGSEVLRLARDKAWRRLDDPGRGLASKLSTVLMQVSQGYFGGTFTGWLRRAKALTSRME